MPDQWENAITNDLVKAIPTLFLQAQVLMMMGVER